MKIATSEAEVLSKLVQWASAEELIRVVLLESSRANPNGLLDILSDYDITLIVSGVAPYVESNTWTEGYGKPLLTVRDEVEVFDLRQYNCMVLYEDGTKIDYIIWPLEVLDRIQKTGSLPDTLDVGYRVLLDKEQQARTLPSPTYTAHIPAKPAQQEFQNLIEEFWFCTTYVAKYLWRDEFMPVKVILDYEIKYLILRRLLEWRIELDHQWSVKPGFFGRGLERYLDAATWAEFEATYVGPAREENWRALFKTIDLFRRVAIEVGSALGYPYPHALDAQMVGYLEQIRQLDRH